MGWENFHSIWDEPADDDKKKSSGPRPNKNYRARDEEDTSDAGSNEVEDRYSYKGAFDDNDSAWYRQSSFRYSGFSDYSPSSLFRSSFSFRGSVYSADNDAKNKAIRALRTLTRNANTVADATAKITYDVQFSAGADSNGVTADMSDKKTQTIYVSPDTVVKADKAEDEDAAIDALTGFVLLRVQLAQEVAAEVVREINKTSVRAMPMALAKIIKHASATDNMSKVAAEFVDAYSAGMLAKSMLTRLSRRAVVEDWGGFAPYFVRHAKQFAHTKENLEKAGLSTESLAAKIAYNMIDDENSIDVDPEVSAIAEKHLGEKLAHEQILPACINLVADLRAYVASKSVDLPEDSLESDLAEGLQEILNSQKDAGTAAKEEEAAMRANMEELAEFFDSMYQPEKERENASKFGEQMNNIANELAEHKYKEKLLSSIKEAKKALEAAVVTSAIQPSIASVQISHAQRMLDRQLSHFGAQFMSWRAAGVTEEISGPQFVTEPPVDGANAQIAAIEKFVKQVRPLMKKAAETLREKIKTTGAEFCAEMPKWEARLAEAEAKAAAVRDKLRQESEKYESASQPADLMHQAHNMIASKLANAKHAAAIMANDLKLDEEAVKTTARMSRTVQQISRRVQSNMGDMKHLMDSFGWHHSHTPAGQFLASASMAQVKADRAQRADPSSPVNLKEWHEPAIDEFLSESAGPKADFVAGSMAEANKDLFEALLDILRGEHGVGAVPRHGSDLEKEAKEKLKNAADSLGMSEEELLNTIRAIDRDESNGRESAEAEEFGQMLQDKLIEKVKEFNPVDEQLFGETVEKRTTLLDGSAVSQVNDEAKNDVEEEYIAYLTHNNAKPKVVVRPSSKNDISRGRRAATAIVQRCRGAIARIREALQFQNNKRTGEVHGLLSGDLDEGSLHKLRYDSEHIWSQKTITRMPDVAVGILVDQSGSMSSAHKIDQAREMCILLAEAVKKTPGVHLHIYGHTANMSGADLVLFQHYASNASAESADLGSLGNIVAHSNNYDGYAIKETAKLLDMDPAKRKYLFVISDGLPHGAGYCGADAKKHVASVCSFVRTRLKIPTYVFAVGASDGLKPEFTEQYGKNNVMFLTQVSQCLPQITRFLRSALQKEKSLVDVSSD